MPKSGKLVLERDFLLFSPRLRPATAVAVDGASGQVVLDQPVPLPDGARQTVSKDQVYGSTRR